MGLDLDESRCGTSSSLPIYQANSIGPHVMEAGAQRDDTARVKKIHPGRETWPFLSKPNFSLSMISTLSNSLLMTVKSLVGLSTISAL